MKAGINQQSLMFQWIHWNHDIYCMSEIINHSDEMMNDAGHEYMIDGLMLMVYLIMMISI